MAVDVAPFTFMVAPCKPPAADDPEAKPSWDRFRSEDRLKLLGIFYGSSIAGPSYARVRLSTGLPASEQIDPEAAAVLMPGDRVIISQAGQPLFGGYMVQGELGIEDEAETLTYRLAGPEWAWGAGGPAAGAFVTIHGQRRRNAKADDEYVEDTAAPCPEANQVNVTAERCTFNPGGRRNMGGHDVELNAAGTLGRIFETPDRVLDGALVADFWTVDKAVKLLVEAVNVPADTGIAAPTAQQWTQIEAVLGASKSMRDVQVDGLGNWAALQRVLGPEFYFYVDPRPTKVDKWEGFQVRFVSRTADVDGTQADFWLDVRGTNIAAARPSIRRVQAVKTIERTVNRVKVLGRAVRHIRLVYWGKETPNKTEAQKALALQHGWNEDQGDLHAFANLKKCNAATVQRTTELADNWRHRHVVRGKDFAAHRQAFRLFTWNEANELKGTDPKYGDAGAGVAFKWYAPDLTGIADGTDLFDPPKHVGDYCRRRRPLLDTQYLDSTLDQWRRVKPTLWIAAVKEDGAGAPQTAEPAADTFVAVPTSKWALDPERAALWITEADLSLWTPLWSESTSDSGAPKTYDDRPFTELLYSGKLRMILEASVEMDWAMEGAAPRTATSGSPVVREAIVRAEDVYSYSLDGPSAIDSPASGTAVGSPVDQRDECTSYAEQLRAGGQDEQVHASVLATGTWSLQAIGKMIKTIGGREIKLTSSSGRGAQIVALHLDPDALAVEYLTETAALELRKDDRVRLAAKRRKHKAGPMEDKRR